MDFTENQQGCIVIEKLSRQRESGHFCDVVLIVNGQKFHAHRNVLAACSGYFHSEFKKEKAVKEKITFSKCKNPDSFCSFLNYMYTGFIMIDWKNVADLLYLANQFLVEKIKDYCKVYLSDHLDTSNCFSVRDLGAKYDLPGLQKNAFDFIQCHMVEVLEQKEVLQFSLKKLQVFLKDYELHVPQLDLLRLFCKWVEFKVKSREKLFETLLNFIDWESLNPAHLEEDIKGYPLLMKNSKCMYLLLSFLKGKNIDLKLHEEKFVSLKNDFGSEILSENEIENVETESVSLIDSSQISKQCENGFLSEDSVLEKDSERRKKSFQFTFKRSKARRKSSHPRKVIGTLRKTSPQKSSIVKLKLIKPMKKTVTKRIKSKSAPVVDDDVNSRDSFFSDSDTPVTKTPGRRGRKPTKDPKWRVGVKCDKCSYVSHNSAKLESHISRIHGKDTVYKCKICDEIFTWSKDYSVHLKKHYPGPPFQCDECEFATSRIYTFLYHLFKHTDQRPFACEQCDHRCVSQSKLYNHMKTHTDERPFSCNQCNLKFKEKRVLQAHLFSHTKEKLFLCDMCGYSTRHKKLLMIHMRTHSGNVYRCDFPDCKFSAPLRCTLKRHQKIHNGIRNHICSYCGAGFVQKNYLTKHERIHLNENPFKCEQCDYCSCRKDKLKEHVNKHHNLSAPSKGSFRPRKQRLMRVNEDNERSLDSSSTIVNLQPNSRVPHANFQASVNNSSSNCNNVNQPSNNSNNVPLELVYDCHSHAPVQQPSAVYNYQTSCNQVVNLPYMGPNLPPPVISHEMPTKFNSFMSFM